MGFSQKTVQATLRELERARMVHRVGAVTGAGADSIVWSAKPSENPQVSRCPLEKLDREVYTLRESTRRDVASLLAKGPQTPFSWLIEAASKRPDYIEN